MELRPTTLAPDGRPLIEVLEELLPSAMTVDRLWALPRLASVRSRWAEGKAVERTLAECRVRLQASVASATERGALPLAISYPEQLPVSGARDEILAVIAAHRTFVLVGETGSGKTTQLPKLLLEAGYGRRGLIALTQPRRVAAVAMASRLRDELAAPPGVVAHSVRFDDRADDQTFVRVLTDGLLLAEAAADPLLSRYDAIIIDEAHERSLNIDLLFGLLRLLRRRRPELVVVVASASIAAERFADHLGDGGAPSPIVRVGGRTFPVDIRWQPPSDDDLGYLGAAVHAVRQIHVEEGPGDILCFLPTERDILEASRRLRDLGGSTVLPLFGRLTPHEQQRIFSPARGRKIVLATNIAETSLTIPGIVFVVDTGMSRIKRYAAGSRTERLPVEAVAQASCIQRAGRAGRVAPGVCIRLYDEEDFKLRPHYTDPEILRSNLAGVVLTSLGMGLGDPESLPWLDQPPPGAWHQARLLLEELGAISNATVGAPVAEAQRRRGAEETVSGQANDNIQPSSSPHLRASVPLRHESSLGTNLRLTPLGRDLAALPADPAVGRILLAGIDEGAPHEACTIAGFLSVQDPRVRPLGQESKADAAHREFSHASGDIATILNLWDRYQAQPSNSAKTRFCESHFCGVRRMREWADVRHQLWHGLRDSRRGRDVPPVGHEAGKWPIDRLHRAVLAGMLGNVLMYDPEKRSYRGAGNREIAVHPGSALRAGKVDDTKRSPPPAPWLVACEIVETSRLFARLCAPIDPEWVVHLAGDGVKRSHRDPHWLAQRRQVVCLETVSWKGLPVRDERTVAYERIDPTDATRVFVREVLAGDHARDLGRDVPVLSANQALVEAVRSLRHRLRRPDIWVEAAELETGYRARLGLDCERPPVIASSDALRRWMNNHGADALRLRGEDLIETGLLEQADRDAPEHVRMGGIELPLRYRYAPGDEDDGVTLTVRDEQVRLLDSTVFDRLIPAWIPETIEHWVRALPKEQRKSLHPLAETTAQIAASVRADTTGSLAEAVHREFIRRVGPCAQPHSGALPPHLRMRVRLLASDGSVIYEGRDLGFIAAQAASADDRLTVVRTRLETRPAASWPPVDGNLPRAVEVAGIGAWLAMTRCRDASGGVAARAGVYATGEAARIWHGDGISALLEAALSEDLDRLARPAASSAAAMRVERALGIRMGALRRTVAMSAAFASLPAQVANAVSFNAACEAARKAIPDVTSVEALLVCLADKVETLRTRLKRGARSLGEAGGQRAVATDLERLLSPGWATRLPWSVLSRLDAHVDALTRRLDLATSNPRDAQRQAEQSEALAGEFDHAVGADSRLAIACGLGPQLRDMTGAFADALLARATPGSGAATGFAEKRLRDGLASITKVLMGTRRSIAETRERLLAARQQATQLPPGTVATRLLAEVDALLKSYPEFGLGCDVEGQRLAAIACCARVRVAVERMGQR